MKPDGRDPARHEFGQKGRGRAFHWIEADLSRALHFVEASRVQRRLLICVLELTRVQADMHRGDPEPCRLNLTTLAARWGVSRPYVSSEVKSLVEGKVLLKVDGRYLLNVNVWDWVESGRIDPLDLDAIIDGFLEDGWSSCRDGARKRSPRVTDYRKPGVTPPVTPGLRPEDGVCNPELTPPVTPGLRARKLRVTPPVTPGLRPAPAPDRNARNYHKTTEELQRDHNNLREGLAPVSGGVDVVASQESSEASKPKEPPVRWKPAILDDLLPGPDSPQPDRNPERHPLTDRPLIRNDPAEVERVAALADFIWPDREVGRRVEMFGKVGGRDKVSSFWAIDIECAILKAAIKDRAGELKTGDPWDYPHGILRNPPDWAEGRQVNTPAIRAGLLANLDQGDDDDDDDERYYTRAKDPCFTPGAPAGPPKVEPKKPGSRWLGRIKRERGRPTAPGRSGYYNSADDDMD